MRLSRYKKLNGMDIMQVGRKTQYITAAQNDHPAILAGRLGEMDKLEIEVYGLSSLEGMQLSYATAEKCWSGIYDDRIILMVGVGSLEKLFPKIPKEDTEGVGIPWMLGTGNYKGCQKTFLRLSKVIKEEMHQMFPILRNFVAVENIIAVNWLKWLGFKMVEKRDNFMNSGRDFYLLESIKE